MTREEPAPEITLGSHYRVKSLGSREAMIETSGIFRGLVSTGSVDGIAIELDAAHGKDKGLIRIIPGHMVLALDILKAEKKKEEAPQEERDVHYR